MKEITLRKTRVVLPDLAATVHMTDKQALMFLEFQEDYSNYIALKEGRVFDIQSGSATVHFDSGGKVKNININLRTM